MLRFLFTPTCLASKSKCIRRRASRACLETIYLLSRPGAGGAGQAMPDSQRPAPGGWNRIQLEVNDLHATVERLKTSGARFRNEIVSGNGGKQILVEDPSGNAIELFEPF